MATEESKTGSGEGRLHIDSDWKKQAQEEKERLAREVEQKPAAAAASAAGAPTMPGPAGAPGGARGQRGGQRGLPPASFATLVQTLATQAALFMADQRDPETGQSLRNLDLAKHNIDLLRVLEEKTKGNLTEDEKHLLETVLYELLMAYVGATG
jgi:gas vesicle protein